MFRSLDMSFHQIICPGESIWETLNCLANEKNVMFTQSASQRIKKMNPLVHYGTTYLKKCEDLLEQLTQIEQKINQNQLKIEMPSMTGSQIIETIDAFYSRNNIRGEKHFEEIESKVNLRFDLFKNQMETHTQILEKRLGILEIDSAYKMMGDLINSEDQRTSGNASDQTRLNNSGDDEIYNKVTRLEKRFHLLFGLIPTENSLKFNKMVFRFARENVVTRVKNLPLIKDPFLKNFSGGKSKSAMFFLFQRGSGNLIYEKIRLILSQFEFKEVELASAEKLAEIYLENNNVLLDTENLLKNTNTTINGILEEFCQVSEVQPLPQVIYLKSLVLREIKFAQNYSFFEKKDRFYHLHIWIPTGEANVLATNLERLRIDDPHFARPKIIELSQKDIDHLRVKRPTMFRLNSLVDSFQEIINTYGVPRYKEINPAIFTIVSFPFFFGLMFGDVGHGLIVLMMGLSLFFTENKSFAKFKFLFLGMGIFSVYCGIIYNEFFSVTIPLFNSCYKINSSLREPNCVYSMGIDWNWNLAHNETAFINSFKMKFSIIIGVLQMLLGTLLKILNSFNSSSYLDLFFEAIPQFLLMLVTFGYMSFCIIVKWMTDWTGTHSVSIIQLFINFHSVTEPLYATAPIQQAIQRSFIAIAFISIFVMLLVKPILLSMENKDDPKDVLPKKNLDEDHDSEFSLISNVI